MTSSFLQRDQMTEKLPIQLQIDIGDKIFISMSLILHADKDIYVIRQWTCGNIVTYTLETTSAMSQLLKLSLLYNLFDKTGY